LIAADARYSSPGGSADTAIKTYSLGSRTGAVAAGNALSVATAAELTRGIAEDNDRLAPTLPMTFYNTVRLFSFFLNKVERASTWSKGCEVVVAGFTANGNPALAKVVTRRSERAVVYLYAPKQAGSLVLMVGQQSAKEQIAAAAARAFASGESWMERATSTIWYLSKHEGEPTIGGGPSVAMCPRDGVVYWPVVTVDERTYLRGFDITETVVHPQDDYVRIRYDEGWHTETDQSPPSPNTRLDEGFLSLSRYVDDWLLPQELFEWKVDPDELAAQPALSLPPSVVVIVRPGEVSWLPEELGNGLPGRPR
jgi:hypothetical protein